jgi:hypothetical protein
MSFRSGRGPRSSEQDGKPTRSDAVRTILKDFLIGYGILPSQQPPPPKRDAN